MNRSTLFFVVAVVIQALILAGVPARKLYTRAAGQSIVLKVAPVDPYTSLSGYYVMLSYEISRPESFPNAPEPQAGETVFAVVEKGEDGLWHPVALEKTLPDNLSADRVALRGRMRDRRIIYGIEECYIPEEKRGVIDDDLRQHASHARVEVKVDRQGHAALDRLRIENRIYE